ncbi:MAG: Amidohydrolase 3 [Gemmatimonadetes bacterium]|nr:Amidohydrolase 3 [Gemmatimonadota bacterium]
METHPPSSINPMRISLSPIAFLLAAALTPRDASAQPRATMALVNGHVVTVDSTRPAAEAVAIAGDRIVAVGTTAEIRRLVTPATRVIDLRGRLVVPGFIDGHGHYMTLGESKLELDLTSARTWDDIVAQVGRAARTAPAGQWIIGRGWHQAKWDRAPTPSVEGNPVHASLSVVSPSNPVLLFHASRHAVFVNASALSLANIGASTPNPAGGEIVRDERSNATGLLRESAQDLIDTARVRTEARRTRAQRLADARKIVQLAGADALSKGITSFHDAGANFAAIDLFKSLADAGQLPVRLYVMVRYESNARMDSLLDHYRMQGYANGYLTVRSIKRQVDGALGSNGAWLLEPYADLPRSTGLALEQPESLRQVADLALRHGFQLNTHAIGDRANREVLDVYERAFAAQPGARDLRWRIEHAQHIAPADLPRFAKLGVIASMQGIHTVSDAPWLPGKLGAERAKRESYLFRSLWDAGVVVTNGTDTPIEDVNPIPSFYGMLSRRTKDGSVFVPEQRLTRAEALRAYTLNNAYASFMDQELGSITPGKYADLVVLSKDVMTIPEREIPTATIDYTIVGGRVKYAAPGATRVP